MSVPAVYFDGKTSRSLTVQLSVQADKAVITGDAQRECRLSELHVSERTRSAARKVTFPDGAYLEIGDGAAFDALLEKTGHRDSFVVRVQQSARGALVASAVTVAILVLGYLYGLPALAKIAAGMLPPAVERAIGHETLRFLDRGMFASSELPKETRDAIAARFASLATPRATAPRYEILFRKSSIGPNAFALPSGQIIVTDEIVNRLKDRDGLMGILAHELGHLHERHLMRQILQTSAVGAAAATLFGDVSSVVAGIPTVMLYLKYSRDAEREADDYAVDMLNANGIGVGKLVTAFEKLDRKSEQPSPYLSSHPLTEERIRRITGEH